MRLFRRTFGRSRDGIVRRWPSSCTVLPCSACSTTSTTRSICVTLSRLTPCRACPTAASAEGTQPASTTGLPSFWAFFTRFTAVSWLGLFTVQEFTTMASQSSRPIARV